MDNVVHNPLPPEEQERLTRLQEELEGQELTALLERLQQQFKLSVNQIAIAADMDESALHKILKGENREFKAEQVDALLDDLEQNHGIFNSYERAIWQRALRIAAFLHFELYKAVEPRLRKIEDPVKRIEALKAYLREQYPALTETYDESGGTFPIFIPLVDITARELDKRWGWIRIPSGYRLSGVKGNEYHLRSIDLFPKKLTGLRPELEVEDTGFGTYTIRQRLEQTTQVATHKSDRREENIKQLGGLEFVFVPAGSFIMGSKQDYEKPQHNVDIPYDYWIGRFPVTNAQYAEFGGKTFEIPGKELHPARIYLVGFLGFPSRNAQLFIDWLNNRFKSELPSGYVFCLPSEAEWEKAARGIDGREWPWGDKFDKNKCNSRPDFDEWKGGSTTPVGAYSPQGDSPYGAADMAGNVCELTRSVFKSYPYRFDDGRENGVGSSVLRGGSFGDLPTSVRTAYRHFDVIVTSTVGFRVAIIPRLR